MGRRYKSVLEVVNHLSSGGSRSMDDDAFSLVQPHAFPYVPNIATDRALLEQDLTGAMSLDGTEEAASHPR